jgi:hypothetical protein
MDRPAREDGVERRRPERQLLRHTTYAMQPAAHSGRVGERSCELELSEHRREEPHVRGPGEEELHGVETDSADLQDTLAVERREVTVGILESQPFVAQVQPHRGWIWELRPLDRSSCECSDSTAFDHRVA